MRWVLLGCAALSGCSALFDLREPVRRGDAATDTDDAPQDDASAPGDGMLDGPPDALSCPSSYTQVGSRYYRLNQNQASWTTAAADCADDGAGTHLIVIGSAAELMLVNTTYTGENELFIGLSDLITDGTFIWVTAEDTMGYPPATGAPWSNIGSEPCVLLKLNDGFNTRDCTNITRRYLCECDGYPDDPSRY